MKEQKAVVLLLFMRTICGVQTFLLVTERVSLSLSAGYVDERCSQYV